jgi:hypothetical protein
MWNATVEHQLTSTMTVEVAYIGNKGTHGFAGDGPAYNVNPRSIVGFGNPNIAPDSRRPFFNKFSTPYFDPITGTTTNVVCWATTLVWMQAAITMRCR